MQSTEDMIVFTVQGSRFAISASAVDEIRNMEGLVAHEGARRVADGQSKVRYTLIRQAGGNGKSERARGAPQNAASALRDDVYFVVAAATHFRMRMSDGKANRVLLLRDCATAVLVDGIERMMQVANMIALPLAFSGEERSWYRGLTVVDEQVLPVINPAAFLTPAEVLALRAGFEAATAKAKGAVSA